ncbi:MAG: recombinase family protein [Clostridia bacterium]|nr:recombinase family protein [Clostridia bacterium]
MKVAIYARLSREDDDKIHENDESESIQNQKSMLINYAIEKSWDIYKIYCDEDYSGIDSERPEFNELIKDAKLHKFDIVLCKTQSRFTRDMEIVEKYLHNKFIEWSIRFVSLVDHVDTEDKGNKKSRQINGLVNEWYLEDLSENIKRTFDSKRKQGLHIGSFVCYGYKRNPKNKNKLLIDDEVAENIKFIFNLYEQGNGIVKICEILNERQILTPTKYKQSKGENFKNHGHNINYWSESTVNKILKNQMYIGNLVQGYNKKVSYKSKKIRNLPNSKRIVVKNTHEPIISKEQFFKVQKIFKSKTRRCKNGEVHLFANKLVCLDCGTKLYKCQNDRGYMYFSCKSSKKIYGTCTRHSIGYENLNELVTNKIREKILAYYNFDNISDNLFVKNNNLNKFKNLEKKKENLSKEMENINKAIKELYLNKVNGKVPEDVFEDLNASFLSDKSAKQKELSKSKNDLSNLKEKELNSKFIKEQKEKIINNFKDFKELNFDIVNSFIDYIEIGEKNKKTNSQDVIIHWNF